MDRQGRLMAFSDGLGGTNGRGRTPAPCSRGTASGHADSAALPHASANISSPSRIEKLGGSASRTPRTAYHHPEGNSYIERFHRGVKEEEVWTAKYRNLEEACASNARWTEGYNRDWPHRGVSDVQKNEAPTV